MRQCILMGQTVLCQESDGEGLGDVVGLEIARGDCAGDDYHGYFMKKQPSRCAKCLLPTNDEKVQEDLVTKTNTLTIGSIEQDLQTVRSIRNTNMADYFSRAKKSSVSGST